MRLVRLVVAGIVLGAVGGFVGALLRPRTAHRAPGNDWLASGAAPLPERGDDAVPVGVALTGAAEVPR
jgi:hypothetical protein